MDIQKFLQPGKVVKAEFRQIGIFQIVNAAVNFFAFEPCGAPCLELIA